jgi:hypothetical protein
MHKKRIVMLIVAGLGIVACFLPWIHVPLLGSTDGVGGEAGKWVLAAFAAVALIALPGDRDCPLPLALAVVASVLGAAAGGEPLLRIIDFEQTVGTVDHIAGMFGGSIRSATRVGAGLYLAVAAGFGIPLSQVLLR